MDDRNNADGSVQRPLALDCWEVPNDIWKKAENELGETDSSREKCLQALKHMIQGRWKPEMSTFEDAFRFGLMCMEVVANNPVTQICGVTGILDLKGLSWRAAIEFTPSRFMCFVSAMQDGFPLRPKETHIVYQPPFTALLFKIMSPLLKEKIRKRIIFHGNDMKSLHKYLPPEILPEEYGGYLGPFENLKFYESLLQSEEMFIQNEQYGYKRKN